MELIPSAQCACGALSKIKKEKESYKLQASSHKLDKRQALG